MKEEKELPRKRRGARHKWLPDAESLWLLEEYSRRRLLSSPRPAQISLRIERDSLRAMVHASISFGGPSTLRELRDNPAFICKVLREAPYSHHTLKMMLSAMLRLVVLTVPDPNRTARIKRDIEDGLIARPARSRSWNHLPRTVGGSRMTDVRRPALSFEELKRIVKAAAIASPDARCAIRDGALMAVLCFSGLSPNEVRSIKAEHLEWVTPRDQAPWCALIHGIPRGLDYPMPVEKAAASYLAALLRHKNGDEYLFANARRRAGCPLSYAMVRQIRVMACLNAGLVACDDVTLKRAYAEHLRDQGVPDHHIRDALGLKTMGALDGYLARHRRLAAQRRVEWFGGHQSADRDEGTWRHLPF
jgi:integrase